MEKKQLEIDLKVDKDAGEVLCDVCEGRGCIPCTDQEKNFYNSSSICWKCQGDGKLDWLSFVTGKPKKPIYYGSSSIFSGTSGFLGTSGSGGSIYANTI